VDRFARRTSGSRNAKSVKLSQDAVCSGAGSALGWAGSTGSYACGEVRGRSTPARTAQVYLAQRRPPSDRSRGTSVKVASGQMSRYVYTAAMEKRSQVERVESRRAMDGRTRRDASIRSVA
jgi:hypothetical protein